GPVSLCLGVRVPSCGLLLLCGVDRGQAVVAGERFEVPGVLLCLDGLSERGLLPEDVVGTQHSIPFFSPVEEAEYNLDRARRDHIAKRWERRFRRIIKHRFPDAVLLPAKRFNSSAGYAHDKLRLHHLSVKFEFPGMKHGPASLSYNWRTTHGRKLAFYCSNGDRETFEAWSVEQKERQSR
ncbi:MAG: hypothetical protein AAFY42_09715, partial [Pseudomonadota bacterium]